MELILKRPIEELIPAMIEWNNKELLSEVRSIMDAYRGKIYAGENALAEMKADRANINKFTKALTEGRMSVKRIYEAPYLSFKGQVDEVIAEADNVSVVIDNQIKEIENEQKEKKLAELKDYWKCCSAELFELVPYEKIHNPKWQNATSSLRNAQMEINDKITDIRKSKVTIEAMQNCDDAEKETLLTLYFRSLDFGEAVRQNESLKEEKKRVAELKARQEQEKQEVKKQDTVIKEKESEKVYLISFSVTGTKSEILALSDFLKTNHYNYKKN